MKEKKAKHKNVVAAAVVFFHRHDLSPTGNKTMSQLAKKTSEKSLHLQ